jgi:hypothetical protein
VLGISRNLDKVVELSIPSTTIIPHSKLLNLFYYTRSTRLSKFYQPTPSIMPADQIVSGPTTLTPFQVSFTRFVISLFCEKRSTEIRSLSSSLFFVIINDRRRIIGGTRIVILGQFNG